MVQFCFESKYQHRDIQGWSVCLDKTMFNQAMQDSNKGIDFVEKLTEDLKTINAFLPSPST